MGMAARNCDITSIQDQLRDPLHTTVGTKTPRSTTHATGEIVIIVLVDELPPTHPAFFSRLKAEGWVEN
jgi:hypothetical protein